MMNDHKSRRAARATAVEEGLRKMGFVRNNDPQSPKECATLPEPCGSARTSTARKPPKPMDANFDQQVMQLANSQLEKLSEIEKTLAPREPDHMPFLDDMEKRVENIKNLKRKLQFATESYKEQIELFMQRNATIRERVSDLLIDMTAKYGEIRRSHASTLKRLRKSENKRKVFVNQVKKVFTRHRIQREEKFVAKLNKM